MLPLRVLPLIICFASSLVGGKLVLLEEGAGGELLLGKQKLLPLLDFLFHCLGLEVLHLRMLQSTHPFHLFMERDRSQMEVAVDFVADASDSAIDQNVSLGENVRILSIHGLWPRVDIVDL